MKGLVESLVKNQQEGGQGGWEGILLNGNKALGGGLCQEGREGESGGQRGRVKKWFLLVLKNWDGPKLWTLSVPNSCSSVRTLTLYIPLNLLPYF